MLRCMRYENQLTFSLSDPLLTVLAVLLPGMKPLPALGRTTPRTPGALPALRLAPNGRRAGGAALEPVELARRARPAASPAEGAAPARFIAMLLTARTRCPAEDLGECRLPARKTLRGSEAAS